MPPPGYPYPKIVSSGFGETQYCTVNHFATPQFPVFADVQGTFQNNTGGCCVNSSGPCGIAGKPACSACGGGGNAGVGSWNLP